MKPSSPAFVLAAIALTLSVSIAPRAEAQEPPGSESLIVSLRYPGFVPEGELDPAARAAQRAAIAALQNDVATRLFLGEAFGVRRFTTIPAMSLRVLPALRTRLAGDQQVEALFEDEAGTVQLGETGPLIRAPETWAAGFAGQGQMIAILDTGVDANHPFLVNKVAAEACFSTNDSGYMSVCPNGMSEMIGPGAGAPCTATIAQCGHGTHVAGIAAGNGGPASKPFSGIARDAQIVSVQVFSRCASGPCIAYLESDVLAGLEWVLMKRQEGLPIAAVNASLGICCRFSRASCDENIPFRNAVANLVSSNVAVVSAAGNDGPIGAVVKPICQTGATIVAASTKADAMWSSSNSAAMVDLVAPGASVESSVPGATYGVMSGTSMAAPHVAGAFAILRQRSPKAMLSKLKADLAASPVSIVDSRNGLTFPRLDVRDAFDRADLVPPSAPLNFTANVENHVVQLAWTASTDNVGMQHYVVYRRASTQAAWQALTPTTATSMNVPTSDLTVDHFRVAAVDTSGNEAFSVIRAVVDVTLTPVAPSMLMSAAHISQLRQAVRLLSTSAGLTATFTDADESLAGTRIKAVHLSELRSQLTLAMNAIGVPPFPSFTDPELIAGSTAVRAVHITELQERVR